MSVWHVGSGCAPLEVRRGEPEVRFIRTAMQGSVTASRTSVHTRRLSQETANRHPRGHTRLRASGLLGWAAAPASSTGKNQLSAQPESRRRVGGGRDTPQKDEGRGFRAGEGYACFANEGIRACVRTCA